MTHYMLLDRHGDAVAEITDKSILDKVDEISGFIYNGKNYLYAFWMQLDGYFFYQEAHQVGVELDSSAVRVIS